MIFDGKPTQSIDIAEIIKLVEDKIAENANVDFKSKQYEKGPKGLHELLKDITAFANATGGYLIIGIAEDDKNRASTFEHIENAEAVRESIIARCLEKIEPRMTSLDIKLFKVDGKDILIVKIPEAEKKPLCAQPDAEHNYYWRRYEDVNKIMSHAEIEACFEGNQNLVTKSELLELQENLISHKESEIEIRDDNFFHIQSSEKIIAHLESQFLSNIRNEPSYRIWVCPIPINKINLRENRNELFDLIQNSPYLRQSGWRIYGGSEIKSNSNFVSAESPNFINLRIYWNGYVEFSIMADCDRFYFERSAPEIGNYSEVSAYSIIEPLACFVLFAEKLYRLINYKGQIRFGLALYNLKGKTIFPYTPETNQYYIEKRIKFSKKQLQKIENNHLRISSLEVSTNKLPGSITWQLIREIYLHFGYEDRQIPFFDDQHRCNLDEIN
jgi:Schlafen, AlbA_2